MMVLKGGSLISGGLSTDIAIYKLDINGRHILIIQDFNQDKYKMKRIKLEKLDI